MKGYIILFIFFSTAFVTSNAQQHHSYSVHINQFKKNKDTIDIDFNVSLLPFEVRDCESILLDFFVEKDERTIDFTPILINGKLRKHTYTRSISLHSKYKKKFADYEVFTAGNRQKENVVNRKQIPYTEDLNNAVLYVTQTVWDCGSRISQATYPLDTLRVPQEEPQAPPVEVVEEVTPLPAPQLKSGIAYIDFPVGRSSLDLSFGNNRHEWNNIMALIREIQTDDQGHIIGLEVTGYASPEGPYELNEKLSYERAKAISEQINRIAHLSLSRNQVKIHAVGEDWDGLVKLIEESYLPYKQETLDIIASKGIFEGREKALMELAHGTVYRTLLREFFPKLRRTEYKIIYMGK